LFFFAAVGAYRGAAQSAMAPSVPQFDAASVRSIRGNQPEIKWARTVTPHYFLFARVTLEELIRYAYDVQGFESIIGGPTWLHRGEGAANFVVEARYSSPGGTPPRAMLRTLLAERFALRIHTGQSTGRVYELRDEGAGQKPVSDRGSRCPVQFAEYNPPTFEGSGKVSGLVEVFTKFYKIAVIDKTGISGEIKYNFCYPLPGYPLPANLPPPPTIEQAAREQLGLLLIPARGEIKTYIVDNATMPSPN